jgi:hypothetical protein
MNLELSDDESTALARLLRRAIDDDKYPLSPRIRLIQRILDKIEPPPVRETPPPLKGQATEITAAASPDDGRATARHTVATIRIIEGP